MKYRPHRGSLRQSMAEAADVADRAALVAHINKGLDSWFIQVRDDDLRIQPYSGEIDERTGWLQTYIVTMRNKKQNHVNGGWYFGENMGRDYFGAIGFTDALE